MKYADAKLMFPNSAHIYLNPTPMQVANCPVNKLMTELGDTTLLATDEPYAALASKELNPEDMS